jgi:tRNA(fMet)-specific endonuclease VapC
LSTVWPPAGGTVAPGLLYMLDTDICSYLVRKQSAALDQRVASTPTDQLCISAITRAEIMYGISRPDISTRKKESVLALVDAMTCVEWNEDAADLHGALRAQLERRGTPIGTYDLLIAAHALSQNAVLVSNNTRHLSQVPGLQLENWAR